jgi:hypothetical protein
VPGFVVLFTLVQRDLLPEEGLEDVGDQPLGTAGG